MSFISEENGATAIEYALIAVGIAVAIVFTVNFVGTSLNADVYKNIGNTIQNLLSSVTF